MLRSSRSAMVSAFFMKTAAARTLSLPGVKSSVLLNGVYSSRVRRSLSWILVFQAGADDEVISVEVLYTHHETGLLITVVPLDSPAQ